jgi:hypothetical protein
MHRTSEITIGDNAARASTRSITENFGIALLAWTFDPLSFCLASHRPSDVMMVSSFAASSDPLGQIYPRFVKLSQAAALSVILSHAVHTQRGLCVRGKDSLLVM